MSKIAEIKAFDRYPKDRKGCLYDMARNEYIKGYDQAMKDIQEQAEKSVIEKSNGEVTIEDLVAYNQGFKTGRELAMKDFLEKAIIAYCEVCKMPNCVMQNQKEICPYLSKFRGCIKSLLND